MKNIVIGDPSRSILRGEERSRGVPEKIVWGPENRTTARRSFQDFSLFAMKILTGPGTTSGRVSVMKLMRGMRETIHSK